MPVVTPPYTMRSYGGTDIGRRRSVNEDAYLCDDETGLWVVADGMGGHAAGEIASQEAIDTVHGMVKRGKTSLKLEGPLTEERSRAAARLRSSLSGPSSLRLVLPRL